MDRRLLFFPTAAVVWAQQTSPAADEAKQALISRVREYYQLMQDKKYRQAETFVAQESKEDYYDGKKPDIKGFDIAGVALDNNDTTAIVTVKAKVVVLMMGAGAQIFEMPSPTHWKLENGQWCWYIPEEVKHATPFGKMQTGSEGGVAELDGKGKAPPLGTMLNQVSIDKTAVVLSTDKPDDVVVIKNGLPGPLTLRLDPHAQQIKGLEVSVEKLTLDSGESVTVKLHWDGVGKISDVVEIDGFPINRVFEISVKAN